MVNTPLHLACFCGSYQIVRYLIDDRKCETNTRNNQGNVPLYLACIEGHLDIVKYIISTGRCDMKPEDLKVRVSSMLLVEVKIWSLFSTL